LSDRRKKHPNPQFSFDGPNDASNATKNPIENMSDRIVLAITNEPILANNWIVQNSNGMDEIVVVIADEKIESPIEPTPSLMLSYGEPEGGLCENAWLMCKT
jgi:hypothetical protein